MMHIAATDVLPDPAPDGTFWLPKDSVAQLPRRLRPLYESPAANEPWFHEFVINLRAKGLEIIKNRAFNVSPTTFQALTNEYIKIHLEATTLKNLKTK